MNKLMILFCVCACVISSSVSAAECIEFAGVNGKKYCYGSITPPFRNIFSYCHALGYHQASTNELCDISSEPSERMVRNGGSGPSGGCKNLMGVDIPDGNYWTAGLYTYNDDPTSYADGLVIQMPKGYPTNSNMGYSGRYAVCYIGGCAAGFVADGDRCVNCGKTRPTDPATITVSACCEYWEFEWDSVNNVCGCPNGYVWDDTLQSCEEQGPFCSYTFTPGSVGTEVADCSYTYSAGSVGTEVADCYYEYNETDNSVSISSSRARGGCPSNQYCALAWSDETCSSDASETSNRLYGVCSPKDGYNTKCLRNTEVASISSAQARGGCPADQYCALAWTDTSCSTEIGNDGGVVYGVCSPKDGYNIMCLRNTEVATISSTRARGGCPANQYCYLTYNDESCTPLTYETETVTYYGVCEAYNVAENPVCPAVTPK